MCNLLLSVGLNNFKLIPKSSKVFDWIQHILRYLDIINSIVVKYIGRDILLSVYQILRKLQSQWKRILAALIFLCTHLLMGQRYYFPIIIPQFIHLLNGETSIDFLSGNKTSARDIKERVSCSNICIKLFLYFLVEEFYPNNESGYDLYSVV